MARIELQGVVKRFGKVAVVHGIDLTVADGEFVVLVGPSGCGKSTTLRMVAGLEDPSGGTIAIDERVVNRVEPKDRNVAMVFQNYAIYPHMSVAKNIGFGLYTSKLPAEQKRQRILETAQMLGLETLLDRRPSELSGGQRQRVAIGRAMVRHPAVFLFDEPLSNLDAQLRTQMRVEIKKLHQRLGTTFIYVTHDQVEAMTMADRIVVMNAGRILQAGSPMELYERPTDVFTARFIGSPTMNILAARLGADRRPVFALPGVSAVGTVPAGGTGEAVLVGVRPQDLRLAPDGELPAGLSV
jgi:multiple sugar transport system ATP-binding protein